MLETRVIAVAAAVDIVDIVDESVFRATGKLKAEAGWESQRRKERQSQQCAEQNGTPALDADPPVEVRAVLDSTERICALLLS